MKKKRIIDHLTYHFKNKVKKNSVVYGQNITTGSRVIGLTNNIEKIKNIELINTQNSEASLVGFGIGLALSGRNSVYFAKQLDFMLLGADQIVNSINSVLLEKIRNTFSIFTYIVDSGYEGPQSRFHCLQEFASLSNINCTYLIFPKDIEENLKKMNKNNFNLYCLSQKFSKQGYYPECTYVSNDKDVYRYKKGNKYTFVCMGFSAYYVYELLNKSKKFKDTDFFVITNPLFKNSNEIIKSSKKTGKVYLFDDSRSKIKKMANLENLLRKNVRNIIIKKYFRNENIKSIYVNSDEFELDKI